MRLLENRVAVVTRATRGIGLAIARTFASHGASLVVAGTNLKENTMITTLKAQLGEKVSTVPLALEAHGQDKSYPQVYPPLAVVFAETVQDVQEVLAWCRANKTPVIPYGV